MRYALVPLFILWFLLLPTLGSTQELSCPGLPQVIIDSGDKDNKEDIVMICLAADKAIAFLAEYNLTPKRQIHLKIVDQKIASHGYDAYGSYDSRTDRIHLMAYDAILKGAEKPMMYGEPFDREHYNGAVAHEVAHAVMHHNLTFKPISPGPQEYLAYTTQLAVLPSARRATIIKAMDVEPWASGDTISDTYMAIEPGKFAVKSYTHLMNMSDPAAFVQILLNAKWFYVYVP